MLQDQSKGPILGARHVQVLLLFTNKRSALTNAANSNPNFPEYQWSEREKSCIISSFYWGYVITRIPSGYWVRRYGVKLNLFVATLGTAIWSLITPKPSCTAWGSWQMYGVFRIMQGLFHGALFLCIQQYLTKWSPTEERNRLGVISYSGLECGTVLAMAVRGLIAEGPLGWPGMSYVSALMCFLWSFKWLVFGANAPASSKLSSRSERDYIETSLQCFSINK